MGEVVVRRSAQAISTEDMPSVEYEDVEAGRGALVRDFTSKEGKRGICFEPGDVLYGKLRPYLGNRLKPGFRGVAVGDWWVLAPSSVASSFLFSLIQSPRFITVANQSSGSKMPRADWKLVGSAAFGIPSLPEQRRIGEFFSTLDSLIAAAERQEDLLKRKKQAYLQLMFPQEGETEPRLRFAGFSRKWEQRQLGEVAEVSTGGRNTQDGIDNGKYPFFIRSQQISSIEQFDYDETAILVPGDGRIGEIFHLYSGKYALHQRVYRVVPNQSRIVPNYLLALMQFRFRRHVLKLNAQGTVPSLRLPFFTDWEMPLPSSPEQRRIGSFFSTLDNLIASAKKRTASLRALKSAYLQRMFV